MSVRRGVTRIGSLALALAAAACLDSIIKPLGPENGELVDNVPNNFRYQSYELDNVSDERVFSWRNDGTTAVVNHNNFIHHGSVVMMVRDGVGNLVDSVPMEWQLETETDVGVPGTWQLTFNYYGARGRVDVNLVRKEEAPE